MPTMDAKPAIELLYDTVLEMGRNGKLDDLILIGDRVDPFHFTEPIPTMRILAAVLRHEQFPSGLRQWDGLELAVSTIVDKLKASLRSAPFETDGALYFGPPSTVGDPVD